MTLDPSAPAAPFRLQGIAASPGVWAGRIVVHNSPTASIPGGRIAPRSVPRQIQLLERALKTSREEITRLRASVHERLDEAHAAIFDPHLLFLEDPAVRDEAIRRIREFLEPAPLAFMTVIEALAAQFAAMGDAYISSRSADVLDVGRRVCGLLLRPAGGGEPDPPAIAPGSVLVAHDLSPSDAAQLDHRRIRAIAAEAGGPASHTAILAKALEIPAVLGLGPALLARAGAGAFAIVDGHRGVVVVHPSPEDLEEVRLRRKRTAARDRILRKLKSEPAETIDGFHLHLRANLEIPDEIPHVLAHGAKGVGLFRTEFLHLGRRRAPTEEEQYSAYRRVVEAVAPDPVVFRTLDAGGDKLLEGGIHQPELNPFLGLRAIRFCLDRPELFKPQLRAILRASAHGKAKIMFPMVSSVAEVRSARAIIEEVRAELDREGRPHDPALEIGVMIEIPSAALTADQFAGEADFFSVGTNDLIQYTLAVDRGNDKVAGLYDPYHPAVLKLIRNVIDAGHRTGVPVAVCGEMASHPPSALLLLGMGIDELSMGAPSIPAIKEMLRGVRLSQARALAREVYALGDALAIRRRVEEARPENRRTARSPRRV